MTNDKRIIRVTHNIHSPLKLTTDIEYGESETVEFIYRNYRVKYFLESQIPTSVTIGKAIYNLYPTLHGHRSILGNGSFYRDERPGDLVNYFTSAVYLNWAFCDDATWHEIKMIPDADGLKHHRREDQPQYSICLPLSDFSDKCIQYYFRLVGNLEANREKAVFLPNPEPELPYYSNYDEEVKTTEYYCDDGHRFATATVYDNPYGPYTNYQLKL